MYNINSQAIFITSMLKSSLCDYSDADILAKGLILVSNNSAAGAARGPNKETKYLKVVSI